MSVCVCVCVYKTKTLYTSKLSPQALPNYEVGKVVYIKGQAPPGGTFIINMVPSLPQDYMIENIALHMSFRFSEKIVVRNHRTDMKWAHEERGGGMPVTPNKVDHRTSFSMTKILFDYKMYDA